MLKIMKMSVASPHYVSVQYTQTKPCSMCMPVINRISSGRLKMQDRKMTDRKMTDKSAGLEHAGLENDGQKCNTQNALIDH